MKIAAFAFVYCLFLSACGVSTDTASAYRSMSATSLWIEHMGAQGKELAFIEAELGSRGETNFGTDYLGKGTSSAYGKSLYSRNGAVTDAKDCRDFSSSAKAQLFFLESGGPVSDPSGLDGDGDGLACEWGKTLKQVAAKNATSYRPTSTTRKYASSGCYVGPRGGRYTISASGKKNYGGC